MTNYASLKIHFNSCQFHLPLSALNPAVKIKLNNAIDGRK
jgi:hypothetical protein